MTDPNASPGRAGQPTTAPSPGDVGPDTDDAIDKAKRDTDAETEEAARQSGYAGAGDSEEARTEQ